MNVYSISGADSGTFDAVFWKGVTERVDDVPLRGSIGVSWQLYQDMREMRSKNKSLTDAIRAVRRNRQCPREPEKGVPYDSQTARFLTTFYDFAEQTIQPFFFIKQGKKALWLVRKTGRYQYVDMPSDPLWNPHRIDFEFVRVATEEEARTDNKEPQTIGRIRPSEELPKPDEPLIPKMPPKRIVTATKATKATVTKTTKTTKPVAKPLAKPSRLAETAASPIPLSVAFMEATEAPLAVEEAEFVKVAPFEHKGVQYFRDPVKQTLYKRVTMGSMSFPGVVIGHWNEQKSVVDLAENAPPSI